jgi:hypothetical protein
VTEAQELAVQMEQAYERGDQHSARQRAQELVAAEAEPELQSAGRAMLRRTEPDAFLMIVGALGLGVMVWLVYAYVL